MGHIEQRWSEYRKACYGDGPVHPVQEKETKQAFHSGFLTALAMLNKASKLPTDEAVKHLADLNNEAADFGKRVIAEVKP